MVIVMGNGPLVAVCVSTLDMVICGVDHTSDDFSVDLVLLDLVVLGCHTPAARLTGQTTPRRPVTP